MTEPTARPGDMILLKEGEVVLKGLNKRYFEQKLTQNIRRRIKPFGHFVVTATQSVIYVEPQDDLADVDGAFEALTKVFGIMTLTRAVACEKDKDGYIKQLEDAIAELDAVATQYEGFAAILDAAHDIVNTNQEQLDKNAEEKKDAIANDKDVAADKVLLPRLEVGLNLAIGAMN